MNENERKAQAYNNQGLAKYKLKQYEQAIKDFDQAIALDPEYAEAYNNRGLAKAYLKQYEQAFKDLDQAIDLNPQDDKAYNNRGWAKDNLEQYEAAIQDYKKAIVLDPEYTTTYYNLARVYLILEKYPEALQTLEPILAQRPDDEGLKSFKTHIELAQRLKKSEEKLVEIKTKLESHTKQIREFETEFKSMPVIHLIREITKIYDKQTLKERIAAYGWLSVALTVAVVIVKYIVYEIHQIHNILYEITNITPYGHPTPLVPPFPPAAYYIANASLIIFLVSVLFFCAGRYAVGQRRFRYYKDKAVNSRVLWQLLKLLNKKEDGHKPATDETIEKLYLRLVETVFEAPPDNKDKVNLPIKDLAELIKSVKQ